LGNSARPQKLSLEETTARPVSIKCVQIQEVYLDSNTHLNDIFLDMVTSHFARAANDRFPLKSVECCAWTWRQLWAQSGPLLEGAATTALRTNRPDADAAKTRPQVRTQNPKPCGRRGHAT